MFFHAVYSDYDFILPNLPRSLFNTHLLIPSRNVGCCGSNLLSAFLPIDVSPAPGTIPSTERTLTEDL